VPDKTSPDVGLNVGIPQRSILGPVGKIVKRHNIKYHCYADDTQVYMTLKPCDKWNDISSSIENCIEQIGICMNSNMLKLNKDKTTIIIIIIIIIIIVIVRLAIDLGAWVQTLDWATSEGFFIFYFASLPLEFAESTLSTVYTNVAENSP